MVQRLRRAAAEKSALRSRRILQGLLSLLKLELITGCGCGLRRCRRLKLPCPWREKSLAGSRSKSSKLSSRLSPSGKKGRNVFLVLRELRLIDVERVLRFLCLKVLRALGSIGLRLP